jgi:hypothetical protein
MPNEATSTGSFRSGGTAPVIEGTSAEPETAAAASSSSPTEPGEELSLGEAAQEASEAALKGAPGGLGTATGVAQRQLAGEEEIPTGEDRGSKAPSISHEGEIQPDGAGEGQKPLGLQAEPAVFVNNGSIDPTLVPSNRGLVPPGAIGLGADKHQEVLERRFESLREQYRTRPLSRRLTDGEIDRLQAPELRAIGQQRGYEMGGPAGSRTTRARFARLQEEDDSLSETEGGEAEARSEGTETARGTA